MVKKLHKSAEARQNADQAGTPNKHMAEQVMASAQQIWLAGMGAFGRAQAEGGKVFENLIKEGSKLQRMTQGLAEDKIQDVTGKMTHMAGEVQAKAGQHWDKLESIFEQRTAKAMAKLGVPTARDVQALSERVDELAAALARLSKSATAPKGAVAQPSRPAAAKKAIAKKATKPAAKAPRKRSAAA